MNFASLQKQPTQIKVIIFEISLLLILKTNNNKTDQSMNNSVQLQAWRLRHTVETDINID